MFTDEATFSREEGFIRYNAHIWAWRTPMEWDYVQLKGVFLSMFVSVFLGFTLLDHTFYPAVWIEAHTWYFFSKFCRNFFNKHMFLCHWAALCGSKAMKLFTLYEWHFPIPQRKIYSAVNRSWWSGSFTCKINRPIIFYQSAAKLLEQLRFSSSLIANFYHLMLVISSMKPNYQDLTIAAIVMIFLTRIIWSARIFFLPTVTSSAGVKRRVGV